MKKITLKYLNSVNACKSGIDWYKTLGTDDLHKIMETSLASDNNELLGYGNWLVSRVMNYKQRIKYTIFAARQVLHIFEEKYPEDKRPRLAIEAAEAWLVNPCEETRMTAYAAFSAADVAAYAAVRASAAAYAAVRASAAAYAARASAAAYAAYSADAAYAAAYFAAAAADAAANTGYETTIKIIRYGISLLEETK